MAVPQATLRAHAASVTALAVSADNLEIVSGDEAGWIVVWSLATRRPRTVFRPHTASVLTATWLAPGLVLTHSRDNSLLVHDVAGWTGGGAPRTAEDEAPPAPPVVLSMAVNALNFCAAATRGRLLAVPGTLDSDTVDVYELWPGSGADVGAAARARPAADAATLARPHAGLRPAVKTGIVMALALAESVLVAGYESGHVAVYALATGATVAVHAIHKQPVLGVAAGPDFVLTSAADSRLARVPLAGGEVEVVDTKHSGLGAVSVRDDGRVAVAGGWDGNVRVFSARTLRQLGVFAGPRAGRSAAGASAALARPRPADAPSLGALARARRSAAVQAAHWVAVGGKDGRIGLWNVY
ncbi:WD40-repeat-containing domain protein [Dipodascopsis tothii]|uniref:WD40-repeat-containing domain protein n=1 Tax=Dipodascopsis tothii TaxID=44089 RepID=UPI0034CE64DE